MDRFDLHWPKTEATFLTDGHRCRIVWRSPSGRGGGPAGSIDNNNLCKKRLADSLPLAPDLLGELRSRGYDGLAAEIQALSGHGQPGDSQPGREHDSRHRVTSWLDQLPGESTWEATGVRRGKSWVSLGTFVDEVLELRAPPGRGRPEWVLKQTDARSDARGKPKYLVAGSLKGIFSYLVEVVADRDDGRIVELVERALGACEEIDHPDTKLACERWRQSQGAQ